MKIAPLAEVKDKFSAYVNECQTSPVVVTRNGKPVAILSGIRDEDDLDAVLLMQNPRFAQLLEAGRQRVLKTGGISSKDFWAEVDRRAQNKRTASAGKKLRERSSPYRTSRAARKTQTKANKKGRST